MTFSASMDDQLQDSGEVSSRAELETESSNVNGWPEWKNLGWVLLDIGKTELDR